MDSLQTPSEPSEPQAASEASPNKRPWSVTLLVLGVLIITGLNLARLILSIRYWGFLSSRSGISPFYLALTGLIWTVAGSTLIYGLWKARTWALKFMQAVALTYALCYWLDQLFLMGHPVSGATGAIRALLPTNWQFSAGVTVVSLAYMVWTLGRSKVKAYFGLVEPDTSLKQVNNDELG